VEKRCLENQNTVPEFSFIFLIRKFAHETCWSWRKFSTLELPGSKLAVTLVVACVTVCAAPLAPAANRCILLLHVLQKATMPQREAWFHIMSGRLGLTVSPDVLEPIYANSPLFSDIYIDSRTSSTAIVAIITPAASLKDIKQSDGTPLFDFDAICPQDLLTSVQGTNSQVLLQVFYLRRRQVHLLRCVTFDAILS
jgi:hypothetical protein